MPRVLGHRCLARWLVGSLPYALALRSLALTVVCCVSLTTFFLLSALQSSPRQILHWPRPPRRSADNTLGRDSWAAIPEQSIRTNSRRISSDTEGRGPPRVNRTERPADCFHALLTSVDPTCDLGTFCPVRWWEEDVLCHAFLRQAALRPRPGQCRLAPPSGEEEERGARDRRSEVDAVRSPKDLEEGASTEPGHDRDDVPLAEEVVTRVAYYVLFSQSCHEPFDFLFMHYLSVVSVQRFLRPRAIYVLGNCVPVGYWWSRVVRDVDSVRFIYRARPRLTGDGAVQWISHLADVVRLQVLLVNGGVYLDTDMILLRPLDPLFKYPLTMGLVDNRTGMGNALILASRGSVFLRDWYLGYKDFRPSSFHHNGMWGALRLWRKDPGSVHMESRRFYSPNWFEADRLFQDRHFDLSDSYAVHVWHRHASVPGSPQEILDLNTTLGRVFRYIYLGLPGGLS